MWDAAAKQLYWIDCLAPALFRHEPASGRTERLRVKVPKPVTGLVRAADGGLLVISPQGLLMVDPAEHSASPMALRSDVSLVGANDGKCDRQGRLWIGTGDGGGQRLPGRLLCIDSDLRVSVMDTGFAIPNGPAFSVDGRLMYLADSAAGQIYRYHLDCATGVLGPRETFASIPCTVGAPDGMTVDRDEHLWVAIYAGSAVFRYSPEGALVERLSFPLTRMTSCTFGRGDLAGLFVTSAVRDWDAACESPKEGEFPDTLFRVIGPARGVPEQAFAKRG